MKSRNIFNKILAVGALTCGLGLTSCNDFLTVLPTSNIIEDDFWKDKGDLEGVRAAAYYQLTQLNDKVLLWGEVRSDNLALFNMSNQSLSRMQQATLMPTDAMFDWAGFYKGINYCNLVLERGDQMTVPGQEVDPSFRLSDWKPIKAEVLSLRALYYFYLVRAFRNVPFVLSSVSTDKQAMEARIAATSGVNILTELIAQLENDKTYPGGALKEVPKNWGNTAENRGRFTMRSIHALLADMYLWRACMLCEDMSSGESSEALAARVMPKDETTDAGETEGGETEGGEGDGTDQPETPDTPDQPEVMDTPNVKGDVVIDLRWNESTKSYERVALNSAEIHALRFASLEKCISHAEAAMKFIQEDYRKFYDENPTLVEVNKNLRIPYLKRVTGKDFNSFDDDVYRQLFAAKNSDESLLELQYNGNTVSNTAVTTYLSSGSANQVNYGALCGSSMMTSSAGENYEPEKGFGKGDIRMLETFGYNSTNASRPVVHKGTCTGIQVNNAEDMTKGGHYSYRTQADANAIQYRLTDLILMRAEAFARWRTDDVTHPNYRDIKVVAGDEYDNCFLDVNAIFERCNPGVEPSLKPDGVTENTEAGDAVAKRLNKNYGVGKTAVDLLQLVYAERQREYVGEGKRWFDIVRQVEASNDPADVLSNFISFPTAVKNRLREFWAYYNPIYNEEYKVNGVEYGGKLVQNPVWSRYAKK